MRNFITVVVVLISINIFGARADAQAKSDADLIKQTALDYIEGWYTGNAERMERSLHPELAKRIVRADERGRSNLGQMGAMTLVQFTRERSGKRRKSSRKTSPYWILMGIPPVRR